MVQKECPICFRQFKSGQNMLLHIRTVHEQVRDFQCPHCPDRFKKKTNLQTHIMRHTNEKPYACTYCPKRFLQSGNWKRHLRTHTGEKPFQCTECHKRFTDRGDLGKHHKRIHEREKPFACELCPMRCYTKSILARHQLIHQATKTLKCDHCEMMFKEKYGLQKHMLTHLAPDAYKCSQCGKGFSLKSSLKGHMQTHSTERKHQCHMCPAKFVNSSGLKCHLRTHSDARPIVCVVCGKTFKVNYRLLRHMRTHSEERNVPCPTCGKKFSTRENMQSHLVVHDVAKFECDICSAKFKSKGRLRQHKKIHSAREKNFACVVCGNRFYSIHDLKVHETLHSGLKPFECSICGDCFRLKRLLDSHMGFMHSGPKKPRPCGKCSKAFFTEEEHGEYIVSHFGGHVFKCEHCSRVFHFKSSLKYHLEKHHVENSNSSANIQSNKLSPGSKTQTGNRKRKRYSSTSESEVSFQASDSDSDSQSLQLADSEDDDHKSEADAFSYGYPLKELRIVLTRIRPGDLITRSRMHSDKPSVAVPSPRKPFFIIKKNFERETGCKLKNINVVLTKVKSALKEEDDLEDRPASSPPFPSSGDNDVGLTPDFSGDCCSVHNEMHHYPNVNSDILFSSSMPPEYEGIANKVASADAHNDSNADVNTSSIHVKVEEARECMRCGTIDQNADPGYCAVSAAVNPQCTSNEVPSLPNNPPVIKGRKNPEYDLGMDQTVTVKEEGSNLDLGTDSAKYSALSGAFSSEASFLNVPKCSNGPASQAPTIKCEPIVCTCPISQHVAEADASNEPPASPHSCSQQSNGTMSQTTTIKQEPSLCICPIPPTVTDANASNHLPASPHVSNPQVDEAMSQDIPIKCETTQYSVSTDSTDLNALNESIALPHASDLQENQPICPNTTIKCETTQDCAPQDATDVKPPNELPASVLVRNPQGDEYTLLNSTIRYDTAQGTLLIAGDALVPSSLPVIDDARITDASLSHEGLRAEATPATLPESLVSSSAAGTTTESQPFDIYNYLPSSFRFDPGELVEQSNEVSKGRDCDQPLPVHLENPAANSLDVVPKSSLLASEKDKTISSPQSSMALSSLSVAKTDASQTVSEAVTGDWQSGTSQMASASTDSLLCLFSVPAHADEKASS